MTAPFRLKAPAPSEQDLLGEIVALLRLEQTKGRVAWFARCNGGGMRDRTGRFLRFYQLYLPRATPKSKGMADLHGMLPGGRYFALEVKRPGYEATPEQARFLDVVRAGGGIAAVVRDFAEVARVLTHNIVTMETSPP